MYQNCCSKCGSVDLYTEVKGTNTGLYCSDCGAYQKWLGKDELRAFENAITKQKDNRWIPVSERLPKREGSYLVSVERTLCNRLEHITETILYNGDGYWHLFSGRVIAWQPLPEPWKESLEE